MGSTAELDDAPGTCEQCRGTGWILVSGEGAGQVRRCSCYEGERRAKLLEQALVPDRYRHCTLDSFEIWNPDDPTLAASLRIVSDFVDVFPEVDRGLLLMGGVGTGKTHLVVAALRELIVRYGITGRFADFISLVHDLQMTFDGSGGQRGIIEPLVSAEVLVLDELGAGKATPWVMDLLYYLVNTRYLRRKLTLFTTNYSDYPKRADEESLSDRVSARVRSRLFEMAQRVQLYGSDYRYHRLAKDRRR